MYSTHEFEAKVTLSLSPCHIIMLSLNF